MFSPVPTRRAVIDPLRLCQVRCIFCYYAHQDMTLVRPYHEIKNEIDLAIERGNDYIDVTGGEPFLYPDLENMIEYCRSKGVRVCVITNAIIGKGKTDSALKAGLDGLLVSVHGLPETHNYLVQHPNARKAQERFLDQVANKAHLRFNFVINKHNQSELLETAKWLETFNPKIVNFINMNPRYEWQRRLDETSNIIANLNVVEPILNDTIAYLEERNIGVNVRYYPMCRIAEQYRRCICNDLHVGFDPFEWDNLVSPKTYEAFVQWGNKTSNEYELKEEPCVSCSLFTICGGINKAFHSASPQAMTARIQDVDLPKNDFYYYRKHNVLTLDFK